MNAIDLLGSVLNSGMAHSSGRRIENSFGNSGLGGAGGILGQILGGGSSTSGSGSGGLFDMLGKMAGSLAGGGTGGGVPSGMGGGPGMRRGAPTGMGGGAPSGGIGDLLGSLAGSLFGGSGGSTRSSAGLGGMAVLGGLAMEALRKMSGPSGAQAVAAGQGLEIDDVTQLSAGLRRPANAQEEQQVTDIAMLTLRAMINAAKADGRIDENETQRIVGKLAEDGITDEEQRFVIEEMRKPMDTDGIARAVPNRQVAAQIYAASLLAIEVDTKSEQRYMEELADKLELDKRVVSYLHRAVGMA